METLKPNMYVRTKKGLIAKIINIFDDENIMKICGKIQTEKFGLNENEILKASHNIIDLIEVGDYVNVLLVVDKYYDYANKEWRLNDRNGFICTEKNINSIVTKEQFESMQYEVK